MTVLLMIISWLRVPLYQKPKLSVGNSPDLWKYRYIHDQGGLFGIYVSFHPWFKFFS